MLRLAKLSLSALLFSMSLSATPASVSAESKEQALWQQIVDSHYDEMPEFGSTSLWDGIHLMEPAFLSKAFSHEGDIMPEGRTKIIHAHGSTALVRFVALPSSPFTGLWGEGAPFGMMRVSLAVAPTGDTPPNLVPGLALKFFVDNHPSVNVMAMPSLEGQDEPNVFAWPYTTDVAKPSWSFKLWLLENRFASALSYVGQEDGNPRSLSLDHLAQWNVKGHEVTNPTAPFSVLLVPSKELHELIQPSCASDFRRCLDNKGEGLLLFEVFAAHESLNKATLIGHIIAKSNFLASRFGDETLFFKHPPVHTWCE